MAIVAGEENRSESDKDERTQTLSGVCAHNWAKNQGSDPTVEAIIRPHKFNFNCRMFGTVFLSLISHIVEKKNEFV